MPYSSDNGKQTIKTVLDRYFKNYKGPFLALDIGAGSGTYPKFISSFSTQKVIWTGIEIWEPYIEQFELNSLYDQLILNSAHLAVPELAEAGRKFDMIFIGDVLEHMTRNTALYVINTCKSMLSDRGMIVVSVPIGEYPQDEYLGNPYEAHVDTWMMEDLKTACADKAVQHSLMSFASQTVEIGVGFSVKSDVVKQLSPTVAAYMICKNEAGFIQRCLNSVLSEPITEVVVCDTGSSDATMELVGEYVNRVKLHQIYISPWRFDDARNAALSFVDPNVDLCISIDGDEMLEPGFVLGIQTAWSQQFWSNRILTRINHGFMTHWNWDKDEVPNITRHFHERVHSRHGYRWIHPVHEKLVHRTEEVSGWAAENSMIQKPDMSKDRSSYGPALEQAVKEDPADWKLWSFLAGERLSVGDTAGAIEAYTECAKLPDSDKVFLHQRLAGLYEWNKQSYEAGEELKKAISIAPHMRENYVLLAELLERFGEKATNEWNHARSCTVQTYGYLRREEVWTTDMIDKKLAGT